MASVIPTAQTLPDGFCPTDWQTTVDTFAATMRVELPSDFGQIIISETTPEPADQDKIWFQVDSNNHVLAIKSWDTSLGAWVSADPVPYYFLDTGSANNLIITTGDNISVLSDLTGRLLLVNVVSTNTSPTTTLLVDSTPATAECG